MDPYSLNLTEDDMTTIGWVGGRYCWSEALLFYLEEGYNEISESMAWELRRRFDQDRQGGHSLFPLLAPDCKLYFKLEDFYDSIV